MRNLVFALFILLIVGVLPVITSLLPSILIGPPLPAITGGESRWLAQESQTQPTLPPVEGVWWQNLRFFVLGGALVAIVVLAMWRNRGK